MDSEDEKVTELKAYLDSIGLPLDMTEVVVDNIIESFDNNSSTERFEYDEIAANSGFGVPQTFDESATTMLDEIKVSKH